MSIADKLTQLANIRSNIRTKLTEKGVEASDHDFKDFADDIEAIESGEPTFDTSCLPNQCKMIIDITDEIADGYVQIYQSVAHGVEIDFGDGSPVATSGESVDTFFRNADVTHHIYTKRGLTMITITANEGACAFSGNSCFMGWSLYPRIALVNQPWQRKTANKVTGVYNGINHLGYTAFGGSRIKEITNVKDTNAVSGPNVASITLFDNMVNVPTLRDNSSLESIKFPSTIKSFVANAFNGCSCLSLMDFTDIELDENGKLPFSVQAGFLSSTSSSMIILFATEEIMNVAKQTTNLTSYASRMHYVGEDY